MPLVEITVSPNGDIQLETRGFTGTACQQVTRALETALGLVKSDEPTPEFFQLSLEESPLAVRPEACP